jgi:hypothetical protein
MVNIIVIIIVLVILLIFINFIYISGNQISYRINAFLRSDTYAGIPSNRNITNEVINVMNTHDFHSYVFIDFGCGFGKMIEQVHPYFDKTICIELDPDIAKIATGRLFGTGVEIKSMDMIDYQFENKKTVLYMYEPLFQVDSIIARKVYNRVFRNLLDQVNDDVYIIYVSGVKPLLNVDFFECFGFNVLVSKRISTGLPFVNNNFYIFKKDKITEYW